MVLNQSLGSTMHPCMPRACTSMSMHGWPQQNMSMTSQQCPTRDLQPLLPHIKLNFTPSVNLPCIKKSMRWAEPGSRPPCTPKYRLEINQRSYHAELWVLSWLHGGWSLYHTKSMGAVLKREGLIFEEGLSLRTYSIRSEHCTNLPLPTEKCHHNTA